MLFSSLPSEKQNDRHLNAEIQTPSSDVEIPIWALTKREEESNSEKNDRRVRACDKTKRILTNNTYRKNDTSLSFTAISRMSHI